MDRVLFLISGPHLLTASRQLALWASGLPQYRFESCIAITGRDCPASDSLRDAGAAVAVLGEPRPPDLAVVPRLRRLVQSWCPRIIHTWGAGALRVAAATRCAPGTRAVRLVASLPLRQGPPLRGASWVDHLWPRQAHRICAIGTAQAGSLLQAGIPARQVVVLPSAAAAGPSPVGGDDIRQVLGLAAHTSLVACLGPLERPWGFGDAVWAFNMLSRVATDLHLLVIGAGPDRARLEYYAHCGGTRRVHFLPPPPGDAGQLLAQVDIVWVPSLVDSGASTVLEAMAVGRPVVASHSPELAELVVDARTGLLFAPGDKAALARQTLGLLRNPELRRRYGEAGRERARLEFAAERQVRCLARMYEALLGAGAEQPSRRAPEALPAPAA